MTKCKGLWEGERREARRVWPVFSFPPSSEGKFSSKRRLGTREVIVKGMVWVVRYYERKTTTAKRNYKVGVKRFV